MPYLPTLVRDLLALPASRLRQALMVYGKTCYLEFYFEVQHADMPTLHHLRLSIPPGEVEEAEQIVDWLEEQLTS